MSGSSHSTLLFIGGPLDGDRRTIRWGDAWTTAEHGSTTPGFMSSLNAVKVVYRPVVIGGARLMVDSRLSGKQAMLQLARGYKHT